jgi:site-specific DNA recombinase
MDQNKKPIKYFMYCRKSSEGEDRQAASLPAQEKELKVLVEQEQLKVINTFRESQSAHHKGRPLFNQMISEIQQGRASGIIVWNLNRIARNPIDAAVVVELMDNGYLERITTPNRIYQNNSDDKASLGYDLTNAKKYSDALSEVVKRGNRAKFFDRKEWSGAPKPGYTTNIDLITRKSTTIVDKDRFTLLQRAARLVISGTHTVGQALYTLNHEWGYKTRPTRKLGGKELSKPVFYRFLSDPYYYGLMVRKEGEIMGSHVPMFSKDEFDLLQIRLGRKGKPHRTDHEFPYKSVLKCGECGGSVTAEEKWQVICPICKLKFHKGKLTNTCPKCKTKIENMINPKILHYLYYHCTKKTNPNCTQKSVSIEDIEKIVDEELKKFEIPKEFTDWSIKYLNEVNTEAENTQTEATKNLHKQYEDILLQIQNTINLKTRPDNVDGHLLSDDEFIEQKKKLLADKESILNSIKNNDANVNKWVYLTEETFKFACYARYWFAKGDVKTKTYIMSKLGNNLTLKNGKLLLDQSKAFFLIEKGYNTVTEIVSALEPNEEIVTPTQMLSLESVCKSWRRTIYDVITYFKTTVLSPEQLNYNLNLSLS